MNYSYDFIFGMRGDIGRLNLSPWSVIKDAIMSVTSIHMYKLKCDTQSYRYE